MWKASRGALQLVLFIFSLLQVILAGPNITIDDLDSRIQYSSDNVGPWVHQTSTGNSEPYLSICYGGSLSAIKDTGTATFTFNGTAVYVQSLLNSGGDNMSTVLDNTVYGPYDIYSSTQNATAIIFSQENLDQNSLHTLIVKKYNESSSNFANIDAIYYTSANASNATTTSTTGTPSSKTEAADSSGSPTSGRNSIHHSSTGAVIGGIVVAAAVIVFAVLGFWYRRRQRSRPNRRPGDVSKWMVDSNNNSAINLVNVNRADHTPDTPPARGTVTPSYAPSAPSSSHSHSDPFSAAEPLQPEISRPQVVPSASNSASHVASSSATDAGPSGAYAVPRRRNTLGADARGSIVIPHVEDDIEQAPPPPYEP